MNDNYNVTNILFLQCHNFTLFQTLKREGREGNPEIEGKNGKKGEKLQRYFLCISSFPLISSYLFLCDHHASYAMLPISYLLLVSAARLSGPMSSLRPFASKHVISHGPKNWEETVRNSHLILQVLLHLTYSHILQLILTTKVTSTTKITSN